jgi:uncharacterized protein
MIANSKVVAGVPLGHRLCPNPRPGQSSGVGDLNAPRRPSPAGTAWARAAGHCWFGAAGRCGPVLLAVFLLACSSAGREKLELPIERLDGTYARLSVEVADTPEKREHGLAGRLSLPRDSGMLFVIETRGRGFWMKDVAVPLSVAFSDSCGYILGITDMEPFSLDLHDIEQAYRFGLEVNRGWFKDARVASGDRLILPAELMDPGCP